MSLHNQFLQRGQTLIETVAAIFVLTMGVSAAVGLANYAFANSTSVTRQIIATGLAEEGIEAVKNIRDTNWLQNTLSTNCSSFPSGTTGSCYRNWNTSPYCIDPSNGGSCNGSGGGTKTYELTFVPANISTAFWKLVQTTSNYGLPFISSGNGGFYSLSGSDNTYQCGDNVLGISDYCRKITITRITTAPYNNSDSGDDLVELQVQSQVWWKDGKRCTLAGANCSVTLNLYLTNWKNF